jgi:membrane glycosyltransferase
MKPESARSAALAVVGAGIAGAGEGSGPSKPICAPIQRASMAPRPWVGHPLLRIFRRLGGVAADAPVRMVTDPRPLMLRRVLLLALVALCALVGTDFMIDVLPRHGGDAAEQVLLVLFGLLFAWISAGFWTGLMGAWVLLQRSDRRSVPDTLRGDGVDAPISAEARTAVIMTICNEHVPTVFAGLRATWESLAVTNAANRFDFFVLSDTGSPDIRAAEQAAIARLVREVGTSPDQPGIHYRWRQHRTRKKAGNVADFCRRSGSAYRYMVILDADSVMTGDCLGALVRMMEAHPDAGIIQTAPRASGHETLHARLQQFGSRAYGPLFTAGLQYWQQGESHYWGHNAILRIAPFMAHCALAPLEGKTSLSGDVMSHDFVEAALMRRAGWKVWIAHDLDGSYEQLPPNLLAELQRDRRWCQGNLQNSRLMFEPVLHPVHRSVLLTGALAYVSAPLWLAFLLLSSLLFASHSHEVPTYFIEPYQLFPIWPTANLKLMLTLFGLTALLLLAPKAMSLTIIVLRREAKQFGGVLRLSISALLEFVYSLLLAPVRMLFHAQFVLAALTGLKLDWKSPPREESATSWSQALQRHGAHTLLALAWVAAIIVGSTGFPWWLTPVLAGLLAAIPISVASSRAGAGRWLRRRSLLLTPEERTVPPVLAEARRHAAAFARMPNWIDAVVDASVHADVMRASPPSRPAGGAKGRARARLVEHAATAGSHALDAAARHRFISDAQAMRMLRGRILLHQAHPIWWQPAARVERRATVRRETPRTQPHGRRRLEGSGVPL